jgi:hypothetical protein
MVVAKLAGGLGNQLFQYAAGRALSVRLARPLWLEASGYGPLCDRPIEIDRFNIQAKKLPVARPLQEIWTRRPFYSVAKRLDRLQLHLRYRVLVDRSKGFDPRFLTASGRVYLQGYWQSERYFQPVAQLIRSELTLRDPPEPDNAALLAQIRAVEAVALHVRRGDYLSGTHLVRYFPLDLDYYRQAIDRLAARLRAPHYFIFSDDPAWTRENIRPAAPVTHVTHNLGLRDFEDLRLMAACRHFIIANSSFSWWGAWLGQDPAKQVIAPGRWAGESPVMTRDRIPADWHIIE